MKYFVLTLFFCAFVATAFSAPVVQDEADEIAAKFTDAIPKLRKAVVGLRADGQTEAADKVENVIPLLKIWTHRETVEANLSVAKILLKSVENLLNLTRKYWEESSVSTVSALDVNKAISNLFTFSEAQDLVAKFKDAIPKLEKVEKGLRGDGQTEAADKLKQVLPTLKAFYTNVAFVEQNLVNARQVWKSIENLLNVTRKYWDNSVLTVSIASKSLIGSEVQSLENAVSALDENEDQEVAEIVAQFKEALPKLVKIADGMRKEGKTDAADKMEKLAKNLEVYTNEENVRAHKTVSKIVLKGVQFMIKLGKRYLEEDDQSAVFVSIN